MKEKRVTAGRKGRLIGRVRLSGGWIRLVLGAAAGIFSLDKETNHYILKLYCLVCQRDQL